MTIIMMLSVIRGDLCFVVRGSEVKAQGHRETNDTALCVALRSSCKIIIW